MAEHSNLLRKTEEARLDQLYQTKCDEVSPQLNIYNGPIIMISNN